MVFYLAVTVAQVVVSLTVLVVVAKNRGVRRRREAKNGIVVEAGRVVVEHVAQRWHGRCGGDCGLLSAGNVLSMPCEITHSSSMVLA